MVWRTDPNRERGLTEGGQTDPLGPQPPLEKDKSPPTLLSPLSLFPFLTSVRRKMCSDRQGSISPRFPSKPRFCPLVFDAYLHPAPFIAMGTEALLKLRKTREAGKS